MSLISHLSLVEPKRAQITRLELDLTLFGVFVLMSLNRYISSQQKQFVVWIAKGDYTTRESSGLS